MDEKKNTTSEDIDSEMAKAYWKKHMYIEGLPDNIEAFRELLEGYSKVPPAEIDALLLQTRDKLWEVVKYPCIGRWGFTNLRSTTSPRFEAAVKRLLSKESASGDANHNAILDVGCCIGQILRHLAFKGVDTSRLYGTDLHPEFIEIGEEFFRDKGHGPTFVAGDMLDAESESLNALDGKVTMIHVANVFHLFNWDDQVKFGTRMLRFLQRGITDAMVFGRQIGSLKPRQLDGIRKLYLHDQESFQKLWDEIGLRTGTKWRVEVEVIEGIDVNLPFFGEDERYIRFGVYQIPSTEAT